MSKLTIQLKKFKWAEIIIILALASALGFVLVTNILDDSAKDRDAARLSDINQIRTALNEYFDRVGHFPTCLYKKTDCISLEGSVEMRTVPVDPFTSIPYAYASIGIGTDCRSFHLGTSLERTESQALLTGSDAPPEPPSALCRGSDPDFSGLSYAPGGQQCNSTPGIAQPTNASNGETCFDLKPRFRK